MERRAVIASVPLRTRRKKNDLTFIVIICIFISCFNKINIQFNQFSIELSNITLFHQSIEHHKMRPLISTKLYMMKVIGSNPWLISEATVHITSSSAFSHRSVFFKSLHPIVASLHFVALSSFRKSLASWTTLSAFT